MKLKTLLIDTAVSFAVGVGTGLLARQVFPPPSPLPPLPQKVVIVREVPKIVTVEVPGKAVEHVKLVTKDRPIETTVIQEVIKFKNPRGRARVDATKFKGLRDGKMAYGWTGKVVCEAQDGGSDTWTPLFSGDLDLHASTAEVASEDVPRAADTKRLHLDVGAGISGEGVVWKVGVALPVHHKSAFTRVVAPDRVGAEVVSVGGRPAVLLNLGKDF